MQMNRIILNVLFLLVFPIVVFAQELEVHFIDVGQGDAILVRTPDERAILIDAGFHSGAKDKFNPFLYLKKQNVKALEAIFITHPHDDHYAGFKYLCKKQGSKDFPIKAIYYSVPPGPEYGKFKACLEQLIARSEVHGQVSARGPPIRYGDVVFTVLSPKDPITEPNKDRNLDSIVMRMTYDKVAFMFTGDADQEIEDALEGNLKSDILKVGHHGSRTASGEEFLKKVAPEISVISSNDKDGKGKTYAHPHGEALETLKAYGGMLIRTDLSGHVVMRSDGEFVFTLVDKVVSQDSPKLWKPGKKSP